jgi:hypothetical protein
MKKNILVIGICMVMNLFSFVAEAQSFQRSEKTDSLLQSYKEQRLKSIPWVQAYQVLDGPYAGKLLKAADATGWGVEVFAGGGFADGYATPEVGMAGRYDGKRWSYRLAVSAITREYNSEAMRAGDRYVAYSSTASLAFRLYTGRYHVNNLSFFTEAGYLYDRHDLDLSEDIAVADGEVAPYVRQYGSGVTYGAGFEYKLNPFASGNSIVVRSAYKTITNTFVNNTKVRGLFYLTVGYEFGVKRHRVR